MSSQQTRRLLAATGVLWLVASTPMRAGQGTAASAETVRWFQETEQALMDSVGSGEKGLWERVMDPTCVVTSEEGDVIDKSRFLQELRPLPGGLTGGITVKELTVQEFPDFVVVRYLADEWETVFGQRLTTKYRVTDTFRRDGKEWKMVASHFAVVTQDPPPQSVSTAAWPKLAGQYRLLPDGWTFTVELRDGKLYGGRDPKKLKPFIPLAPNAFVLSGSLGEWIFVADATGRVTHILDFRKFESLVWTRVENTQASSR
jgi:uncharacterized protein DUF4440